ncbi:hypothetical protein DLM45_09385 [Hyphomicrobium methylovorum]|nr:hypothetical protein [Hyphomicrobium methylovorum]
MFFLLKRRLILSIADEHSSYNRNACFAWDGQAGGARLVKFAFHADHLPIGAWCSRNLIAYTRAQGSRAHLIEIVPDLE